MPFGLTWLSSTCGTTNLQCSEQAGQLVDHLIPSRSPMSMNLGDWEISLRRHGLGGDSEPLIECSDSDAVSTRVPTACTQNRYTDGLTEIQEEEPFESFDLTSHIETHPVLDYCEPATTCPQKTEEAVSIVQDDLQDEEAIVPPRRRQKVMRKIFKALPVLITFSNTTEAGGEIKTKSSRTPTPRPGADEQKGAGAGEQKSAGKPDLEVQPSRSPELLAEVPKSEVVPPEERGVVPQPASEVEKVAVEKKKAQGREKSTAPSSESNRRAAQLKSACFVPSLTLDTASATVVQKHSYKIAARHPTNLNLKALVTQSSQSSHEPFSGMSEVMESQSTSFQASPLALERLPSNTERADRDDCLSVVNASMGSSTTREKTGSSIRTDFPCQFLPIQDGSATPPLTLEALRATPPTTTFKALTSLIIIQSGRLLVKQAFKSKEVIAVIDPVLLCSGREQSCCLGMAGYVSSFAKKPGFPAWGDSNASFISHMSLTISRQEPRGHVLKGVYPYCHLLFKPASEPNVECVFHAHQVVLVALTSLAAETPLIAHRPSCSASLRELKSKLYRSCSTALSEPFGTGSRADINHFSLHAETERYSARKSGRKESKELTKTGDPPVKPVESSIKHCEQSHQTCDQSTKPLDSSPGPCGDEPQPSDQSAKPPTPVPEPSEDVPQPRDQSATVADQSAKPCDSLKKEQSPQLSWLTTASTEMSRDAAETLFDRIATEDQCEAMPCSDQKCLMEEKRSEKAVHPSNEPFQLLLGSVRFNDSEQSKAPDDDSLVASEQNSNPTVVV